MIALNYKSVLNTCYAVLPHMVAQKSGVIINISSDAGRSGSMGELVYAGCKAAVIALSKTLAREHARDNIRVNVVSPGSIDTTRANPDWYRGQAPNAAGIPLQRQGTAEEIAATCLFLVSDDGGFITGQTIHANGGVAFH